MSFFAKKVLNVLFEAKNPTTTTTHPTSISSERRPTMEESNKVDVSPQESADNKPVDAADSNNEVRGRFWARL